MNVRLLTEEQKDLLEGQCFKETMCFNPILDADDNWFISEEEVQDNENVDFNWISELPIIPHNPIIVDDLI